jgi:hypothetical protein
VVSERFLVVQVDRFHRNRWTVWIGIAGRVQPERVDDLDRNRWTVSGVSQTGDRNGAGKGGFLTARVCPRGVFSRESIEETSMAHVPIPPSCLSQGLPPPVVLLRPARLRTVHEGAFMRFDSERDGTAS